MITLTLHGNDVSKAPKANDYRLMDERTRNLGTVTQVWTWEDGEAVVMLGGMSWDGFPIGYYAIRLGGVVRIVEGSRNGIRGALRSLEVTDEIVIA